MTTRTSHDALAEYVKHLAGLGKLPPPERQHPALQAMAVLALAAERGIEHELTPMSVRPHLTIAGLTRESGLVAKLLDEISDEISDLTQNRHAFGFSARGWVSAAGLDDLVVRSIEKGVDDASRTQLLAFAASKAQRVEQDAARLQALHMSRLLLRDAPWFLSDWQDFQGDALSWLLDAEHHGDPGRSTRVTRRFEAYGYYAAIVEILREPAITAVIDAGEDLVPALRQRLGLTRAQLRSLHQAALPTADTSHRYIRYGNAVRHLLAHDVPLHEWPGGGRPSRFQQWNESIWTRETRLTLIRPEYFGESETVRDAVRNFRDDLLDPLLSELTIELGKLPRSFDSSRITETILDLRLSPSGPSQNVRLFLACVRRALIGPRGPKSFQQAAQVWHRRSATISALRHEHQDDRPGWPALCAARRSACGRFEIVPLTTAEMLVEEGNAHQHCVGSYYDACRSGRTQILSLRDRGTPAVTAEILLGDKITTLRVGQFKGFEDQVPDDPGPHEAMRAFLHDLRSGVHPINLKELRQQQKWADQHWHQGQPRALSLDHARAVFPLYLPLLPRGTPVQFDQWCEQTGLKMRLTKLLPALLRMESGGIEF